MKKCDNVTSKFLKNALWDNLVAKKGIKVADFIFFIFVCVQWNT